MSHPFRHSLFAFVATALLGAFMVLGLIADGALRRVELVNQEAFTAAPRIASSAYGMR